MPALLSSIASSPLLSSVDFGVITAFFETLLSSRE